MVPRVFLRDLIFYILGLSILVASSFTEGISLYFSIGCLIWYAFFIVLVAIEDVREKREKKKAEKLARKIKKGKKFDLEDFRDLQKTLPTVRPTIFFSVPRFYEKVWEALLENNVGRKVLVLRAQAINDP